MAMHVERFDHAMWYTGGAIIPWGRALWGIFLAIVHIDEEPVEVLLYESKSRPWNALDLLAPLTPAEFARMTADQRAEEEPMFWESVCSEYDAENMCLELERRRDAGEVYSPEFWSFEAVWRRDEMNQYIGFRRLYALIYGRFEADIAAEMAERAADFSAFGEFLTDEFKLCLMLAYDELATTRSYAGDVPFFRSLGHPALATFIERVRGDEAMHYLNALRVAQRRFPERLPEAPAIIQRILDLDLTPGDYRATFILDHKGPSYTPAVLRGVAETLTGVIIREQA
jgi:hypothetical protein